MTKEELNKRQKKQEEQEQKEKKRKIIVYSIAGGISLIFIIAGIVTFSGDKGTSSAELLTPESESEKYNSKVEALNQGKSKDVQSSNIFDIMSKEETKEINQDSISQAELDLQRRLDSMANLNARKPRKTGYTKPKKKTKEVYGDYEMWDEKKAEPTPEPVISTKRRSRDKYDFDGLTPIEQRRVLLKTGLSHYQESGEISATILSRGTVRQGQTLTFITNEQSILSLEKIPRGTTISGIVSFDDSRLNITFSTMRLRSKIIKVNLELYGSDGLKGLPVDGEEFIREQEDNGINEASSRTGRLGQVLGGIVKSKRTSKSREVEIGRDVRCILVNKNNR